MATPRPILVPSDVFEAIEKNTTVTTSALPLDARKGQDYPVTEADVLKLLAEKNWGAIKGLKYAGKGNIKSSYVCTVERKHKDARVIEKDGRELRFPIFEGEEGADDLIIQTETTQPVTVPAAEPVMA